MLEGKWMRVLSKLICYENKVTSFSRFLQMIFPLVYWPSSFMTHLFSGNFFLADKPSPALNEEKGGSAQITLEEPMGSSTQCVSFRSACQGPQKRLGFLRRLFENSFLVIMWVPKQLCIWKIYIIHVIYSLYSSNLAWWLLKMSHLMSAMSPDPSEFVSHHLSTRTGAWVRLTCNRSVVDAIRALIFGFASPALAPGFLADWKWLVSECCGFCGSLFLLPFSFTFKLFDLFCHHLSIACYVPITVLSPRGRRDLKLNMDVGFIQVLAAQSEE